MWSAQMFLDRILVHVTLVKDDTLHVECERII